MSFRVPEGLDLVPDSFDGRQRALRRWIGGRSVLYSWRRRRWRWRIWGRRLCFRLMEVEAVDRDIGIVIRWIVRVFSSKTVRLLKLKKLWRLRSLLNYGILILSAQKDIGESTICCPIKEKSSLHI